MSTTSALRSPTALWNRMFAVVGRVSMYRLVVVVLTLLAASALALSLAGLVGPGPLELLAASGTLAAACVATDVVAHRILGRAWRAEASMVTALILLFVLQPTTEPLGLVGLALAGVVASASKYLLAWRGRHLLNPAAVGATVLTVLAVWFPALGASSWWVGTPWLSLGVALGGLVVAVRTEKVRVVGVFLLVAVAVAVLRTTVQFAQAGLTVDVAGALWQALTASPFLFLGAFMLSEPLTLPPRRRQQMLVAAIVGILAGWPLPIGDVTLGQERALLIGNLVAAYFAARTAVRLTLTERTQLTPTVRELGFRVHGRVRFLPGQYLELDVPHPHPDARGTRREFSILSSPAELPTVRIAMREGSQSTYKRALAAAEIGDTFSITGIWGDFVLPRRTSVPVLMVAAGIGVTPFVSQLRHLRLAAEGRDVVFVYVVSAADELAFRADLEDAGIPVIVFSRDEPADLPDGWVWAGGRRLDADGLVEVVPDIAERHAYVSGPPALIADLAPALQRARAITTDAFSGY